MGTRNGVEMDPFRMQEFDRLCIRIGAPNRRTLPTGVARPFRDNLLPASHYAALSEMSDYLTCNRALIVRCGTLAVVRKIEERIPDMAALGYFPTERLPRTPVDSPAWRRFATLCEEFGSAWDEYEQNMVGHTISNFTPDELRAIDRAACAYGITRIRLVPIAVIHTIRAWRRMKGDEGNEVDGGHA